MHYRESYMQLSHGTTENAAISIKKDGFILSQEKGNWCGKGVYFYDIKAKAWWAAKRKCEEVKKETGKKSKPTVIYADVIDLPREQIFDLRVYSDLCEFENLVAPMLEKNPFDIMGIEEESEKEKIIILRSILISFFAYKNNKKMVVGHFLQRPQPLYEQAIRFSSSLDMIFGIETIYCVKDINIITNIT